jgi:crossover junction endodeoxyribonuclease RusA
MEYNFELPFPPSNNTYYRKYNNRMVISKRGRAYKQEVIKTMNRYGLAGLGIDYKVNVRVQLFQPDNRTRDSDNFLKGMFDALTECKFWLDDSLVIENTPRLEDKSENPRAVLLVYPDMDKSFY